MLSKRDILVQTAFKLFADNGFNATGIDKILKKASVNKMTMYKYFPTKNDLILATLDYAHDLFVVNVLDKVAVMKISPKEKILKIFDMLWTMVNKKDLVRCLFINASAEFPDHNDPIHQAASLHKISTEDFIKKLLKEMKLKNAVYLSRIITVLSQGALVMAQISGDKKYYLDIKKACLELFDK